MSTISKTWWGQRFLQALESCTDEGRLQRGRSYSGPTRMMQFAIEDNVIHSSIRGNINPYFGVYKEPRYTIEIQLKKIPTKQWQKIIGRLSKNAGWLSRLLLGEVPENIERAFAGSPYALLPTKSNELQTKCSCPDWANPCKHIAGTYYYVSTVLDQDPFLLFQLRGLSRQALIKQLSKSPLGKTLATQLQQHKNPQPQPLANRYPSVSRQEERSTMDYKQFWQGRPLDEDPLENKPIGVSALIIRREGDSPPFWPRHNSFIEAMSEIYQQVQYKSKYLK